MRWKAEMVGMSDGTSLHEGAFFPVSALFRPALPRTRLLAHTRIY